MVELKDENIIFSKYLDTDIDSICIHFSRSKEGFLINEYVLPESYKYIAFVGTRKKEKVVDFIEVANLEGLKKVIEIDNKCLPDLMFEFKHERITLINFFKKYIFKMSL